jgi:E3 ubiquitin-protein ligase RNF14
MLILKSEQCIRDQELKSVRQADVVKQIQKEVTTPGVRNYPCPSCHQQNPKVKLSLLLQTI